MGLFHLLQLINSGNLLKSCVKEYIKEDIFTIAVNVSFAETLGKHCFLKRHQADIHQAYLQYEGDKGNFAFGFMPGCFSSLHKVKLKDPVKE